MLSKSLIQFSVDGQGCVPSLLFDLRPNYSGGNEDNGNLLQKVPCMHCCTQCPRPCSRPPLAHTSAGDSWTLPGKSGSVSCGVTVPFSWILVHTRFCLCPPRVCFPVLKRVLEKHLLLLYWLNQSLCLYGSQQTVENFSRDGNIRPPDLPPEKSVCRSRSYSYNWIWNNRLVPSWERSTSRLYIVTLVI